MRKLLQSKEDTMLYDIRFSKSSSHDEALSSFEFGLTPGAYVALCMKKVILNGKPAFVYEAAAAPKGVVLTHRIYLERSVVDCRKLLVLTLQSLPPDFVKNVLYPLYSQVGEVLGVKITLADLLARAATQSPVFAQDAEPPVEGLRGFEPYFKGQSAVPAPDLPIRLY